MMLSLDFAKILKKFPKTSFKFEEQRSNTFDSDYNLLLLSAQPWLIMVDKRCDGGWNCPGLTHATSLPLLPVTL